MMVASAHPPPGWLARRRLAHLFCAGALLTQCAPRPAYRGIGVAEDGGVPDGEGGTGGGGGTGGVAGSGGNGGVGGSGGGGSGGSGGGGGSGGTAGSGGSGGSGGMAGTGGMGGTGGGSDGGARDVGAEAGRPPAAPAGLMAVAGNAQVSLSWSAASGATSYNVKRSLTAGGPYTSVGTPVTATSYVDQGLSNGRAYEYVVSGNNGSGEGPPSAPASATPTAPPPTWSSQDIGAVGVAGSTTQNGGTFTVAGAGADIFDNADAFRYVFQTVMGDATIVARVVSLENVQVYTKAAVMMRNGLAADASNVLALTTPTVANGYRLQARLATADVTSSEKGGGGTIPVFLRLVRRGNTVTGSFSPDGATWTTLGTSKTVSWPAAITVGVAVTSHDTTRTATAVFDNLTLTTP